MAERAPILLDSITDLRPDHAGMVAVSGSHGGLYPAAVASNGGLGAVLFNDAGIGFERAGIAGVLALADVGMAAAAADCMSCEIGSARDMWDHGRISAANSIATGLGVVSGMTVAEATDRMRGAPAPRGLLPSLEEARRTREIQPGRQVALLDSASLVGPEDAGGIVVTGSHGALIGGDPARALKAAARVAVFNDAGGGRNGVGTTRLPALDHRGIAAVTVSHDSARIGDAVSSLDDGRISAVNATAERLGARVGQPLLTWLTGLPED